MFLSAHPLWSMLVIGLCVTVVWAVLVHDDDLSNRGSWLLEAVLADQAGEQNRAHDAVTRALDLAAPQQALPARPATPVDPLTSRELELLTELPSMRTTEQIADSLYVSVNTVKTHLRGIYRKLGVNHHRRDAVVAARRRGLL